MKLATVFSGIGAPEVATPGWDHVWAAEIDEFSSAVLAHRFPGLPNLGDVTKITEADIERHGPFDVLIGGSPCQDLSVAGGRAGLAGERSGLFHHQVRIFHAARSIFGADGPRWLVWENVPGALSTNQGRDFAAVVEQMAGLRDVAVPRHGWGKEGVAVGDAGLLEWAVLDAQWFRVAQRRRRVFAVLDAGDWRNRPPVLLEPESLRGDSPPRCGAGEDAARSLGRCPQPFSVANTLTSRMHKGINTTVDEGRTPVIAFNGRMDPVPGAVQGALDTDGHSQCVALQDGTTVRRLTPTECERLQGFPDGWTAVEYRGKPASDTPRYKALGNSMAVPVVRWIADRIAASS